MNNVKEEYTEKQITELLKENQTRDRGFSLLVQRYQERLYAVIRRMVVNHEDAQDVLQETLINAYRYLDHFRGEGQIYTWIYRIAMNECLRLFRDKKMIYASLDESDPSYLMEMLADESPTSEEVERKFQAALLTLPEKQKLVFTLRYFEEMPYEEMSKVLNTSVGALKTNYHFACEKIKQRVTEIE